MMTLKNLVHKGVKVDLGMPYELWDEPSVEVSDMKKQVSVVCLCMCACVPATITIYSGLFQKFKFRCLPVDVVLEWVHRQLYKPQHRQNKYLNISYK